MSLKELTADSHQRAESTEFMKRVFDGKMSRDIWADWTYQKALFYNVIEAQCRIAGYLDQLPGIERTHLLMKDYKAMTGGVATHYFREPTLTYYRHILSLPSQDVLAHLYTWHMGDLFGGQMIKKIVDAPHTSLDFENAPELMSKIRSLLTDDLAPEANRAFDYAIEIMQDYYE